MDFLGIGPLELVIVFIIILLILGPKEMVKTGKTIGEIFRKISRSDEWKGLNKITREIRTLPNRLAREAELESLKEEIDLNKQISPIAGEIKESATVELDTKPKPTKNIDNPEEVEDTSPASSQEEK
jgi:Sec-independent protein translocase protein TatA